MSNNIDAETSKANIEFYRIRKVALAVNNMVGSLMERLAQITAMEARILLTVGDHPDSTATEISQRVSLTPVQVGRSISRLKSIDLVDARPSLADGRAFRLTLTAEGRERYEIAGQISTVVQQWAIRGIDPKVWSEFSAILDVLVVNSEFSESDVSRLESELVQRLRKF